MTIWLENKTKEDLPGPGQTSAPKSGEDTLGCALWSHKRTRCGRLKFGPTRALERSSLPGKGQLQTKFRLEIQIT